MGYPARLVSPFNPNDDNVWTIDVRFAVCPYNIPNKPEPSR